MLKWVHLLGDVIGSRLGQKEEFKNREEQNTTTRAYRNFAFYESYFSNYIEGAVFEIDTAKRIIATQQPLPARNEDSHDVLGTYQLASNKQEMRVLPYSGENLIDILKYRHAILLSARADKKPGVFKDKNNQAGNIRNQSQQHPARSNTLFNAKRSARCQHERDRLILFLFFEVII